MDPNFSPILDMLRAAGEPTRLRILALLRQRDLSVGELVQVLGQSQPRLSHHLKTLASAGLVERLPEGSFVFYRAASDAVGRAFLDSLFVQLPENSVALERDKMQLAAVSQARADHAEAYFSDVAETWDTVRALHYPNDLIEQSLLEIAGAGPFRRIVDFGTGTGRMLTLLADKAEEAEGIDFSHQMLTVARANLERAGIETARVRQGDVAAVPFEDATADLVIIHQVLHFMLAPGTAIAEAARILEPGGRAIVVDFAPHELEFLRTEHGHQRLGVRDDNMQSWARDAGLLLHAPQSFKPPVGSDPGLTVNIWLAEKPSLSKEAAA